MTALVSSTVSCRIFGQVRQLQLAIGEEADEDRVDDGDRAGLGRREDAVAQADDDEDRDRERPDRIAEARRQTVRQPANASRSGL